MPRNLFSSEQIITKLREAEVLLSQGMRVNEAARQLYINEQTYLPWPNSLLESMFLLEQEGK